MQHYCKKNLPLTYTFLTMNNIRKQVHDALTELAESILAESVEDVNGLYWKTLDKQPYGAPFIQVNEEIYNGNTGISLLMLELYEYTGNTKYLEAAKKSTQWLTHWAGTQAFKYYTFYTGCVGIIYLYIKMFDTTGEKIYLDHAVALQELITEKLHQEILVDDLLSGYAGVMLVFTSLYAYTKREDTLQLINHCISHLLKSAFISRKGLKWGYIPHSFDSLCGMSHGAAGIGFALLETGKYFNNEGLCWLAAQAYEYESQYYSSAINNWLELRVLEDHLQNPAVLDQEEQQFFMGRGDIVAWSHGAAGIGLSRLRAWQLTGLNSYRLQALKAVKKVKTQFPQQPTDTDFTLSTGTSGRAWLLIEAAFVLNQKPLLQIAGKAITAMIDYRKQYGLYPSVWGATIADPALMMGSAGIASVMLHYLLPDKRNGILTPILNPNIPAPEPGTIQLDIADAYERTVGRAFPKTIGLLAFHYPGITKELFNSKISGSILSSLINTIKTRIAQLPDPLKQQAKDLLRLEMKKNNLRLSFKSILHQEVKQRLLESRAAILLKEDKELFNQRYFRLNSAVTFMYCRWNWALADGGEKANWPVLLSTGIVFSVHEHWLSEFSSLVLEGIKEEKNAIEISNTLIEIFDIDTNDADELLQKVNEQLRVFLKNGFIEEQHK
jgi:Lanthionine synthetase C-like protein